MFAVIPADTLHGKVKGYGPMEKVGNKFTPMPMNSAEAS